MMGQRVSALTRQMLPQWVRWIAQDADGTWWGYECEPHRHDSGWYENEVGRSVRLRRTEVVEDWQASLKSAKALPHS